MESLGGSLSSKTMRTLAVSGKNYLLWFGLNTPDLICGFGLLESRKHEGGGRILSP